MALNVFPVHIDRGFHKRYVNRNSRAVKEALKEVTRRLENPISRSERKLLRDEKFDLEVMLEKVEAREGKRNKRMKKKVSTHQMIESVRRMDMNPSRKDICRPGRAWRGVKPGAPPVRGGFTDGHGRGE